MWPGVCRIIAVTARVGVVMLVGTSGAAFGGTIYVDDDAPNDPCPSDPLCSDPDEDGSLAHPFDSIREGVDAAVAGDEVVVLDGYYAGWGNVWLGWTKADLTVRSQNGPETCVIDAWPSACAFFFNGPVSGPVICGFTICNAGVSAIESEVASLTVANCILHDNGRSGANGAVYCVGVSHTITDCIFHDNRGMNGGAVHCDEGASPTITNCTFHDNEAILDYGGAVSAEDGSCPVMINCRFVRNIAPDRGGAVGADWTSHVTLTGCEFSDNSAGTGGAVYGRATMTNCLLYDNYATWEGGAISSLGATIANCTMYANTAGFFGGAVACDGPSQLTNCTFYNNTADGGAAIYVYTSGPVTLENCTVYGNTAYSHGGAIHASARTDVRSCILWANLPEEVLPYTSVYIAYSDVHGGWAGEGNLNVDPLFVDADGPDDVLGNGDDNLRLSAASPCINTGDPEYEPGAPPGEADLDGHPRLLCGRVDMGAYEFGSGDYDCNRAVNLADYAAWTACMTGPEAGPYPLGCEAFDFDTDADVDLADFSAFEVVFAGG
ncbi:MAG TPA: right-handed parallel beta-helix repeat-containing protein [Phycisphaerae bacterium]|nr:right-handed parallel beta-helix repeat-containing protein [Phycisphaerae bacterium]HNU45091.1 right-handed parallel beta-helix repeat-containing protein [Phycisphaerae bacterium]